MSRARDIADLQSGSVSFSSDLTVGDDIVVTDDIFFNTDGSVINFGINNEVTLTHVHDTGLLLNSTNQLQFGDSGTYIHQSADGVLDLVSDTEIEINATTIDINGAVDISGNATFGGDVNIESSTPVIYYRDNDGTANNYGATYFDTDTMYVYTRNGSSHGALKLVSFNGSSQVDRLTIDASGNATFSGKVGIGTSSIDGSHKLQVEETTSNTGVGIKIESASWDSTLTLANGSHSWEILNDYSNSSSLNFYNSQTSANAVVIDSSSNLLVGKSSTGITTAGHCLFSTGQVNHVRDGNSPLTLGRLSSDGNILDFYKDSSSVGSIGVNSTRLLIQSSGDASGLRFDGSVITPFKNGSEGNGTVDLGYSSGRFKDLYLSGGLLIGGTGSANKLDDYEEGTWTPLIKDAASGNAAGMAVQSGFYTKIGNVVYVIFACQINSVSGMTSANTVNITGLPFTVNSDTAGGSETGSGLITYINNLDSGSYGQIFARADNNTTTLELIYSGTTYTSTAGHAFQVGYFDSGADTFIAGSCLYRI